MPLENFKNQREFGITETDIPEFLDICGTRVAMYDMHLTVMNADTCKEWFNTHVSNDDNECMYNMRFITGVQQIDRCNLPTKLARVYFDIGRRPGQIAGAALRAFFLRVGNNIKTPSDIEEVEDVHLVKELDVRDAEKDEEKDEIVVEEKTLAQWVDAFHTHASETSSRRDATSYDTVESASAYTSSVIGKRLRDMMGIISLYQRLPGKFVFPCDGVGIGYIACKLMSRNSISGDSSIVMAKLGESQGTKVNLEDWRETIAKVDRGDVVILSHCVQFCEGIVHAALERTHHVMVYEHDSIYDGSSLLREVYAGYRHLRTSTKYLRPLKVKLSTDDHCLPSVSKWTSPLTKNLPFIIGDVSPLQMISLWKLWGCRYSVHVLDNDQTPYIRGELMRLGVNILDRRPVSALYLSSKHVFSDLANKTFDTKSGQYYHGVIKPFADRDIEYPLSSQDIVKTNFPSVRTLYNSGVYVILPVPGLTVYYASGTIYDMWEVPRPKKAVQTVRDKGKKLPHPKEDMGERPHFVYKTGPDDSTDVVEVLDSNCEVLGFSSIAAAKNPHVVYVSAIYKRNIVSRVGSSLSFFATGYVYKGSSVRQTVDRLLLDAGVSKYTMGHSDKFKTSEGYLSSGTLITVNIEDSKSDYTHHHIGSYKAAVDLRNVGKYGNVQLSPIFRQYLFHKLPKIQKSKPPNIPLVHKSSHV